MKKGFTLVELIATIAVLAIIAGIVTPLVYSSIKNNKEKLYDIQLESIKKSARVWAADNISITPKTGDSITITLGDLIDGGYIDSEVINSNNREEISKETEIVISNNNGKLEYDVEEDNTTSGGGPIITLNGKSVVVLNIGDTYIEEGATAVSKDGQPLSNITTTIQVKNGSAYQTVTSINTNTDAEYRVVYEVSDGGKTSKIYRNVFVRDVTKPVITVNDKTTSQEIDIAINSVFIIPTATVTDDSGEAITATVSGTVDTSKAGTYNIVYKAVDSSGNKATLKLIVNVLDNPTFTWDGSNVTLARSNMNVTLNLKLNKNKYDSFNLRPNNFTVNTTGDVTANITDIRRNDYNFTISLHISSGSGTVSITPKANIVTNILGIGNAAAPTSSAITIDSTGSNVSFSPEPSGWYNEGQNVSITTDDDSGVATKLYCITTSDDCEPNIVFNDSIYIDGTNDEKIICITTYDNIGNINKACSGVYRFDKTIPTVDSISSTDSLKATSQTVTFSCSDNNGITGYYFGANSNPSLSDFTEASDSDFPVNETISSAGTYYALCKDVANNVSSASQITYYNYTVDNRYLNPDGTKGTYNNLNYTSNSSHTYLAPSGTIIIPTSAYTAPSYSVYAGMSLGAASSETATMIATNPVLDGTTSTYTAWFNRVEYTVTLNPNEGTVSPTSISVGHDAYYMSLPTPTRRHYTFVGWFTDPDNGTRVRDNDLIVTNSNHTLYAHWTLKTAILDIGTNVNAKIKTLAAGSTKYYYSDDTTVEAIKRADDLPNGFTPSTGNTISSSTSDYPVYAWFDSFDNTVYYYSEAGTIYMNADSSSLLFNFKGLTDALGIEQLDTSNVVNVNKIFSQTVALTTLDLSGFNTSNVQDMSEMFRGCTNLATLNLNGLDTHNVTDMSYMFYDCEELTTLDLSGFNTESVQNMSYMFTSCAKLTSLDLSSFNTSRVTTMYQMFYNSNKLVSLDLSSFDMSLVSNTTQMISLSYGNSLREIKTPKVYSASKTISLPKALYDDSGNRYTALSTSSPTQTWLRLPTVLDTGQNVTTKIKSLASGTIYFDSVNTNIKAIKRSNSLPSGFTPSSANTISKNSGYDASYYPVYIWFDSSDNTIYYYSEAGVIFMNEQSSYLLYNFRSLEDASGIEELNTSIVTTMAYMFGYDQNITILDLSEFDMGNVTSTSNMLSNMTSLNVLKTPKAYPASSTITLPKTLYDELGNAYTSLNSSSPTQTWLRPQMTVNKIDYSGEVDGSSHTFTLTTTPSSNVTIYYSTSTPLTSSNCTLGSCSAGSTTKPSRANIGTTTVYYAVFDTTGGYWPYYSDANNNNATIEIQNITQLDTGQNVNAKIKTLVAGTSKTYSATDTTVQAIKRGASLPSGFTPSTANTISSSSSAYPVYIWYDSTDNTIYYYSQATDVYMNATSSYLVSNFRSLTNASGIESLKTTETTNMSYMFYYNQSLTTLDLSSFDMSRVTSTSNMLAPVSGNVLKGLKTPKIYPASAKIALKGSMVDSLNNVYTELSLGSPTQTWIYSPTQFDGATTVIKKIKSLAAGTPKTYGSGDSIVRAIKRGSDLPSGFTPSDDNTISPSYSYYPVYIWFDSTDNTIYYYSEADSVYMNESSAYLVYRFSVLTDVSGILELNTSLVTSMSSMFDGSNSIVSLDLSDFDTSRVTNMSNMFSGCSKLTSLDLSSFDMSKVTNTSNMFNGVTNLGSLKTPNIYPTSRSITLPKTMWDSSDNAYTELTVSSPTQTWLYGPTELDKGQNVNAKIKTLVSGSSKAYSAADTTVQAIKRSNNLPSGFTPSTGNTISSSASRHPVYIWYDNTDNTVYYYSQATDIYMNVDSSYLLSYFRSLTDASGIEGLDTSNVTTMSNMFNYNQNLISIDLSNFNTSKVTSMGSMFYHCESLTTLDLSAFDMSTTSTVSYMLNNMTSLTALKTPNVYPASYTITLPKTLYTESGTAYTTLDSTSPTQTWLKSQISVTKTDYNGTYDGNTHTFALNTTPSSNVTVYYSTTTPLTSSNCTLGACIAGSVTKPTRTASGTTTVYYAVFDTNGGYWPYYSDANNNNATITISAPAATLDSGQTVNIKIKELAGTDTEDDMEYERTDDYNVHSIVRSNNLPNGFTPNADNTISSSSSQVPVYIWYDSSSHTIYYYSSAETIYIDDPVSIFGRFTNLTNIDLSSFDTSNATSLDEMFIGCNSLTTLDLSNFDTSNVEYMFYTFASCQNLTTLDISSFDLSNLQDEPHDMFSYTTNLVSIKTPQAYSTNYTITLPRTFYTQGGTPYTTLSSSSPTQTWIKTSW